MSTGTAAVSLAGVPIDPDLDPFADEVLLDSLPAFERLREQAPVVYLPRRDLWAITRYEDIRAALANPGTFSSTAVAFNEQANRVMAGTTIATDPPDHQRLREALMENLTPRALRGLRERISARAVERVAELAGRGSFDALEDLAQPYVVSVVVDLIGVRGEHREHLLRWGEGALNMQGPLNGRGEAGFSVAGELFRWTRGELKAEDLLEGSIGRGIFDAADRGDLPMENRPLVIEQLVVAGMDTTITAIANAVILFARHPEQYQAVREDPSLIPSAFAEVLRYLSPLPMTGRRVLADVEIQGVRIPAGAQAALLVAAGNRDPRHFPDPGAFDVTRNPTDHLAFGYGIHGCAGQALARMEALAMITALATRLKAFTVGTVEARINNITRPYRRIDVTSVEPA